MQGNYRAVWLNNDFFDECLEVVDQRMLPFEYHTQYLTTAEEVARAIKNMTVSGAGVIKSIALFGVYITALEVEGDFEKLQEKVLLIKEAVPSVLNFSCNIDIMVDHLRGSSDVIGDARRYSIEFSDNEAQESQKIAQHGCKIIEDILKNSGKTKINILTHSSVGWLSMLDDGSALAPIYEAKRRGIDVHVWVDETRPLNEGASLSAWELAQDGIEYTIISDGASGYLMQKGEIDMVIVGADSVNANGVINTIGTYLKALAASDNAIPFYVATPTSTFDFATKDISIELRSEDEAHYMRGVDENKTIRKVRITPENSHVVYYAFDVTPERLITGFITQSGIYEANFDRIQEIFKKSNG
jgi:methylthioribose-1-phosphate isomerase